MIVFMISIVLAVVVAYWAIKKFGLSDEEFARILYPDRFEKPDVSGNGGRVRVIKEGQTKGTGDKGVGG